MMRVLSCLLLICATSAGCSDPISLKWKHELEAPSVSTPLVTESFIAVGHEVGLSIVEPDGTPRCEFPTHQEVISAPKTDGKRVFFGSTNYIFYAIDSGCTEQWRFVAGDRIKSDPLVADGRVYVSSYDGHVYALSAETGQEIWRFPRAEAPKLDLPPQPHELRSAKAKTKAKGKSKRKRKAVVEPAVEEKPAPPPPKVGDFSYSSPYLADGIIYVGNLDHFLYAIDAKDGTLRGRFRTEGPVTSSPLVEGGVLYFGSNDGNVYAIELGNNKIKWRFTTQDWVNSSPVIADGVMYIGGNDRHVYAIDIETGRLRWKLDTKGPVIPIPAIYKNLVFAAGGSGDGTVYAIDRKDGSLFWRYQTGSKIESDPVLVGNRLFVSSADLHLYAFEIERTTRR